MRITSIVALALALATAIVVTATILGPTPKPKAALPPTEKTPQQRIDEAFGALYNHARGVRE